MDRDSARDMDELAHLRRTGLPILGTQAIVIQRNCESTSGVASQTHLPARGAAISANALIALMRENSKSREMASILKKKTVGIL